MSDTLLRHRVLDLIYVLSCEGYLGIQEMIIFKMARLVDIAKRLIWRRGSELIVGEKVSFILSCRDIRFMTMIDNNICIYMWAGVHIRNDLSLLDTSVQ